MNQVDLGAKALWTLIPVSILAGLGTVFVFRRWSDRHAIRITINRMLAHMLEFRLFVDEPILILRAQRDLLVQNWHLLRLLLRPSLILLIPFAVLLAQMNAYYGRAPLRVGDPAILTLQFRSPGTTLPSGVVLKTPDAIRVETPGLRVVSLNQISWRIRPTAPVSGHVQVIGANEAVTKSIAAGQGLHHLSERRTSSLTEFLIHLNEAPFFDTSIAWIEVRYPSATIVRWPWLVWFLLISSGTAIVIYAVS
jgi:hypothetical protein